jgi:hypothetical protein
VLGRSFDCIVQFQCTIAGLVQFSELGNTPHGEINDLDYAANACDGCPSFHCTLFDTRSLPKMGDEAGVIYLKVLVRLCYRGEVANAESRKLRVKVKRTNQSTLISYNHFPINQGEV